MPVFDSLPAMRVIGAGILSGTNILITGNPGEAKTAKISSLSKTWGYYTETIVLSNREPTDFLGIPTPNVDERVTEYYPLRWAKELAEHPKSLAIFDEFSLGADCFAATLQFFAERRVGELQLHDGVSAIAIMNPSENSEGGTDLSAPTSNRFLHLDWTFDAQEWRDGLITDFANIEAPGIEEMLGFTPDQSSIISGRSQVLSFIQQAPHHLNPGPPKDALEKSRPWASPRTWTYLATMLGYLHPEDEDAIQLAATGTVGSGPGMEFVNYLRSRTLIDPWKALENPQWAAEQVNDPGTRLDVVVALISSIEAIVLEDPDEHWQKAMMMLGEIGESDYRDYVFTTSRRILSSMPAGKAVPKIFADSFGDLLEKTGRIKRAA